MNKNHLHKVIWISFCFFVLLYPDIFAVPRPILDFSFNEGTGALSANHGSLKVYGKVDPDNSPEWGKGKTGSALKFTDKRQRFIIRGQKIDLENFTIECWIKPKIFSDKNYRFIGIVSGPYWCPYWYRGSNYRKVSPEKRKELLREGHSPSGWRLYLRNGVPYFGIALKPPKSADVYIKEFRGNCSPLRKDEFTHIAVTYNGLQLIMYCNGEVILNCKLKCSPFYNTNGDAGRWNMRIEHFIGVIDDLKLFDYPLSSDEILREAGKTAQFGFLRPPNAEPFTELACYGYQPMGNGAPAFIECDRYVGFTGKTYNRYLEGDSKTVDFSIRDISGKLRRLKMKLVIEDWRNLPVKSFEKEIKVNPHSEVIEHINLETGQNGCFFLNMKIFEGKALVYEKNEQYAIVADASGVIKKVKTPFGRHYHDGVWNCKRIMQPMSASHVRILNYTVSWMTIEPERGKFVWKYADFIVNKMKKRGYDIMICLHGNALWATDAPESVGWKRLSYPPRKIEDWENFVRKIVKRYKNDVKYWEIFNEPDAAFHGSIKDYLKMLKSAYRVIKAEDPEAKVAAIAGTANWYPFCKRLFKLGGANFMDIFTLHLYGISSENVEEYNSAYKEIMAFAGKKIPFWDSESGVLTPRRRPDGRIYDVPKGKLVHLPAQDSDTKTKCPTPGERMAAAWYVQRTILKLSIGVKRIFDFDRFYAPKGAYTLPLAAREALIKIIGNKKFIRRIPLGEKNIFGYLFGNTKKNVAVFWAYNTETNITINCDADSKTIKLADFLGNMRNLPSNRALTLNLSDYPVYVIGCGEEINLAGQPFLVTMKSRRLFVGTPCTIEISNRSGAPALFSFILRTNERQLTSSKTVNVLPGGKASLSAVIYKDTPGRWAILNVKMRSKGGKVFIRSIPVQIVNSPFNANIIKHCDIDGNLSEWVDRDKMYVNDCQQLIMGKFTGNPIDPYWKGSKDLSAVAAFAWSSDGLYFACDVTDDNIFNKKSRRTPSSIISFWNGDGVELFLDLRSNCNLGKKTYSKGVYHIFIIPAVNGEPAMFFAMDGNNQKINFDYKLKYQRTFRGYSLELFLKTPPPDFPDFKPVEGRLIGMNFYINDADKNQKSGNRKAILSWQGTAQNHMYASRFGLVKLIRKSSQKK